MPSTKQEQKSNLTENQKVINLQKEVDELTRIINSKPVNDTVLLRKKRNELEIKIYTINTRFKVRRQLPEDSKYYIIQ